ncbi:hypothetical protein BN59_00755 [Legionella massiliensis]|uniref:Mitochondrial carrier protein n=1 Tax=Legionella massiliensis TaxID=1034943 RepID=A0A078KTX4_9GAMM|nr:hypothetical protein [Legionella massiliensis]CDZ76486.1 hypothetical protein BN59_00755 [Legionella massiliensis]CEE12224.1 hypothetical protein BN1094_00755 [Legionella massiliensis]
MQSKNEQNHSSSTGETTTTATESQTTPNPFKLNSLVWNGLNFTTVAAVTSGAVVAIQSPVKTVLVNLTKDGNFLPSYSGGTFGLFRAVYAGTLASLTGSSVRTLYVTGTKKHKPMELTPEIEEAIEVQEKTGIPKFSKTGYVMAAAFGDIIVTQIPESLSHYKKMPGFLPKDFQWKTLNNSRQLMLGGFMPRYLSGVVNFSALCVVEDKIAKNLPIDEKNTRHFTAGALSGMTAAFFSYPFTLFKDYTLTQTTVNEQGELRAKNSFTLLKEVGELVVQNPKEMGKTFVKNAVKQLPLRMGLTGAIFATVAGVGEILGSEPLDAVVPESIRPSIAKASSGFFSHSQPVEPEPTSDVPLAPASNNEAPKL